jgi:phenylacetate-CoA ligase
LYSAFPEMVWPAIAPPVAATLLALQFQLEHSQWWPAEKLRNMQFIQLDAVLRHAWNAVPFYQARLAATGYDPQRPNVVEVFKRLPLLTRSDIQQAGTALHATHMPQGHGKLQSGETSGSTGRPITFVLSELETFYWYAYTLRDHLWHQRDFSAKLGAIRYALKNEMGAQWGPATNLIFDTGPCAVLRIDTPLSEQIEWLCREQPQYLISYASNIDALARAFIERNLQLPSLCEVRSVSETVRPELRQRVQEAWGAKLTDMYTAKETGYLALQCPQHDHYHVQAENVLLEIIDDNGAPCAPGVTGRVVVTALQKFAMPLIRYEIGDYAVAGAVCDCGRGLPVIKKILGRQRNMLRLPNGDQRWPLCDLVKQADVPGIRQYQYVQHSLDAIEVRLAVSSEFSAHLEPRLTEIIHQRLGHPFQLNYTYYEEIARTKSGKYEDFICAIDY